jgi:ornithine decarboxylase/arginine decarboxylase
VIPEFYQRRSARYAGVRLRDLCSEMHGFFRGANVSALQAKQFLPEHLPEIAMSPRDAARYLVRNDVDYLPIDAIGGRIATTPFVVYPPGIATIVPGERLTERAQPMIDYLKMFETCFNTFQLRGRDSRRLQGRRASGRRDYMRGLGMNRPMQSKNPGMANELPVLVRPSRDSDVEAMLSIYRRHIRRGIEENVDDSGTPEPEDLHDRRKNLRNHRLPHLVATSGGEVVGYAYVVLFRKRPAYRFTVKHSIYVHHEHQGRGVGRCCCRN